MGGCKHLPEPAHAIGIWHCGLCGKRWPMERTVRRGLGWIVVACVVGLWALGGGLESWAAMVAEIGG